MRISIVVLALLLSSTTFAQSQPEGFRNLKWGIDQTAILAEFPGARCDSTQSPLSDWSCFLSGERINDVPGTIMLNGYLDGAVIGFSSFYFSFKSDHVQSVADAFAAKYGAPTRVEQTEFLTLAGGRFPNIKWLWEFPAVQIWIVQHSARLGNASAAVHQLAAMREFQKRREELKRGAGKGL